MARYEISHHEILSRALGSKLSDGGCLNKDRASVWGFGPAI